MRAHMAVRAKQGAGELTSGTMSPTLGVSIGFARLARGRGSRRHGRGGHPWQVGARPGLQAAICP